MARVNRLLLSCILFTLSNHARAANRYWVASSTSNWNNTANWSNRSGGPGGSSVPNSSDAVIFDNKGIGYVVIDVPVTIKQVTISSGYPGKITQGANAIVVGGIAIFSGGIFSGGTANITFQGDFTLSGTAFTATAATLEFDGNSTFTSGSFSHNNGTVIYDAPNGTNDISGTAPTFNNLQFTGTGASYNITAAGTVTTGNLTLAGTSKVILNSGTIDVNGNVYLTNTATTGGGTAVITITGSGNQTIDGTAITAGEDPLPYLTINKPGGSLTLKGNITESEDWDYMAGTVDAATFTSSVAFGGNLTVTSNGMSFYDVSVTSGTISLFNNLTALGNLSISAGKLAPAANSINVAGNWSDYGTGGFTEATSTVTLDGSALQTITTPGGESFNNLVIDNTGSGIKLVNNVTVSTALTMTSGNINLNTNNLTLGTSAFNIGTLNYSGGTITNTGSLIRWFNPAAIAGNAGLFPMGTATNYRPFLVSTTASPIIGGTISVQYTDATTSTAVTIVDGAATVKIRKDLNWKVAEGNGLTGGTYDLQVQGTGYGSIGSVSDLRLTLVNSVVGTAGTNGGTVSDPQVNRTGLSLSNLNNTFYIGSTSPITTPLALNLLYFNGTLANGQVILGWATPGDNSATSFLVQRSEDGHNWGDIQTVAAAGVSGANHYYSATDADPFDGTTSYRLLQTDAAGDLLYSSVLSFTKGNSPDGVSVYPVPAADHLTVSFPGMGHYIVQLFNAGGQPVREPLSSTGNSVTWQTSGLAAGVYFVRVLRDGAGETRTVMVR